MSKSLILVSLLVLVIIIKDCQGALFFGQRFNPRVIQSEQVQLKNTSSFLRHAFSFYKRLCFQDEMTESVSPPTPPTLSQILRFWTNSEGMQNQKIILKNPIPLCSKQVVFPKTKEKCGYLKAFVCSKTCKVKLVT